MSTKGILDEPAFKTIMNAAIIYDDPACAVEANMLLEKASYRAGEVTLLSVKPWRLDLLNLPSAAAEALRETADTQLIVLALRRVESSLAWLLDWLEQWAAQRQAGEAALAVFKGGGGDALSPSAVAKLLWLAERHGLNFIFDDSGSVQQEFADFLRDLHEREVSMTPTLQETLRQVTGELAHQHWGINE